MAREWRASTTAHPNGSTIRPPAQGRRRSLSEAKTAPAVVARASRSPVTVTLQFLPGAEPWVRCTRDGTTWRQPATLQVWEFILLLNGWYAQG
jgi:hypothetical protein